MNRCLWAFAALIAPMMALGQEAQPLTLEQSVQIAKKNAYEVLLAEQDVGRRDCGT